MPTRASDTWSSERCTHFAGATPFLVQLLAAARRAETRLPDLKLFVCGGASVPPSLIREAADYFERAVVTRVYGSTEVPVTTVGVTDRNDVAHAADTDGRAGIASIKLTDANGATAETGEVVAQGPQMLVGYVHPEDEATVFDAAGLLPHRRPGAAGSMATILSLPAASRTSSFAMARISHPRKWKICSLAIPTSQKSRLSACPIQKPASAPVPLSCARRGATRCRKPARISRCQGRCEIQDAGTGGDLGCTAEK